MHHMLSVVHGSTYSNCTDGQVRLFGGSTDYEGTVEVCINNAWGTINDEFGWWRYEEAQTVCNALGYTAPGTRDLKHCITYIKIKFVGAQNLYNAYFGEGTGPILLYYMYCSAPTFSLLNCNINSYHYYYYYYYYYHYYYIAYSNHYANVGVRCQRELEGHKIQQILH